MRFLPPPGRRGLASFVVTRRLRLTLATAALLGLMVLLGPGPVPADSRPAPVGWSVYPRTLDLSGYWAESRVVAVAEYPSAGSDSATYEEDVTRMISVEAEDATIVTVSGGMVRPRRNGTTYLKIRKGALSERVPVTVRNCDPEADLDFERQIIPVFNKLGCNAGACHGAASGKGGFRLSLLGFDPPTDHDQIVKAHKSRRVVLAEPERSLLLQKPTLQLEHVGGHKLTLGSGHYERLLRWLEQGAPPPRPDGPRLTGLEVQPPQRRMKPGDKQRLRVEAIWSDDRREDVTALTQFDVLTEGRTQVTDEGEVTCTERGEGLVMIRYLGQATVFTAVAPYAPAADAPAPSPESPALPSILRSAHPVDQALVAKWRGLGLGPAPRSDDAEFMRRVYLDVIGTLPTPEEVRKFLGDPRPNRRAWLVEALMERPEFIDFWTLKWGDMLRNNRTFLQEKGMWTFHRWIQAQVRTDEPIDEMVRQLVTAQGSTFREGAANFYRIGTTPADWAESATQVFLGVRLQCAKCHHHPFEKWSQDDYHGLAACFARMGAKGSQEYGLFGRETVVFARPDGEHRHPRRGLVVKPQPLDAPPFADDQDRREQLAAWLTDADNPYFARNIANRLWAHFMGRGLVEPVDDLRATNPPTVPDVLDALAAEFRAGGCRLKPLVKAIVLSEAYQLSAAVTPANAADVENLYFTRYRLKRLGAEQLADALDDVTETREKYPGLPLGTRAIQLPDSGVRSYLLDVFGRPARQITCECERTAAPNIGQALHLINGDIINGKIARAGGRIDRLTKAKTPLPDVIAELYLATLSRPPTEAEAEAAAALVTAAPNPRVGLEDLVWALVNSREFLFVH
ncbi:MAG TPA: DUF1549 and DUF1553 domain-containing protein [Gemmatales bacterium]|nr:DUF1549 and DUF1553 domain-containing protein [Gemmatales bacterium]